MATIFCDGSSSEFKSDKNYKIDDLVKMFEISPTDVENIQRWKQLKANGETESDEFRTLTETLASKIVTADAWNKLCDCMVNLQKMYVNKGLDEIDSTVENYVAEYTETNAKEAISKVISTTIEGSYQIDAVKIIISTTTPDVVNGALWIKPKA